MNSIAAWPAVDRATLFNAVYDRQAILPLIIEKDFWVCWTLAQIFALPDIGPHLIFKGDVLLKAFNLIERFSEDIDLGIDPAYFNFTGEHNLETLGLPNNRRRKLIEELKATATGFVSSALKAQLEAAFSSVLGSPCPTSETWQEDGKSWCIQVQDEPDGTKTLAFIYPSGVARPSALVNYIKPTIKLEVGARSAFWPAKKHVIASYAAEEFPTYFRQTHCSVLVLEAERTFWEKATILHMLYYWPQDKPLPARYSRHFYDLSRLAISPSGERAINDLNLLRQVVEFKKRFFENPKAHYNEACPGTLRLLPHEIQKPFLFEDYEKMQPMFFKQAPSFEEILEVIGSVEARINSN